MENKEPDDDVFDRLNVSQNISVIFFTPVFRNVSSSCNNVPDLLFCMTGFLAFLQTSILNKHLQELMDGLTAKVFRTYNASITLQQQLKELTSGTHRTKLTP